MRLSSLFASTLREAPAGVAHPGQQWLMRAGFLRVLLGHRVYSALGVQTLQHLSVCVQSHLAEAGIDAQFIAARDLSIDTLRAWCATDVRSYRQLPRVLMATNVEQLDLIGLDPTQDAANARKTALDGLLNRVVEDLQIAVVSAAAVDGTGLFALSAHGDASLLTANGYAAMHESAQFIKPAATLEAALPIEKVATPECKTIDALAQFLGVPKAKTAKAVFLVATLAEGRERFVFAIVRGDMDLSEAKLRHVLGALSLRPATEAEIRAIGAVPGYASPIHLPPTAKPTSKPIVIVDDAIPASPNLVAGANDAGYHLRNTNCPRDYVPDIMADIALAHVGDRAPSGQPLRAERGACIGQVSYPVALSTTYLAADGKPQPIWLTRCEINLAALLESSALQHHDANGLAWPRATAPFDVHVVALAGKDVALAAQADALVTDLTRAGLRVLYDDRAETPGVKLNDADLIGLPVRMTVSAKALEKGGVEVKRRNADTREIVPFADVIDAVRKI